MRLSVVVQHYNNWDLVWRHLVAWGGLPPAFQASAELIVVDDGSTSPAPRLEWPAGTVLARVDQDVPWNQSGARNLGVHLSSGEWLLLTDVDHVFAADMLEAVLASLDELDGRIAYTFGRVNQRGQSLSVGHNIKLLRREVYERVGGVDEDFAGAYGYEDKLFTWQLQHQGFQVRQHSTTVFVDSEGKTRGLNRDLTRNRALLDQRMQESRHHSREQVRLRFPWSIVVDHRARPCA